MAVLLIVLGVVCLVSSSFANSVEDCPLGYSKGQRLCFKKFSQKVNWEEANRICKEEQGGNLAEMTDDENEAFLKSLVGNISQEHWIGLKDKGNLDFAAFWFWESDGSPLGDHQPWLGGEPDKPGKQRCVSFWKGGWADEWCYQQYPFLCQRPVRTFSHWIPIMTRTGPNTWFNLTWTRYEKGFGPGFGRFADPGKDGWFGLEELHHVCHPDRPCELKITVEYNGEPMVDSIPKREDGKYVAMYHKFAVGSKTENYKLIIGDFDAESSTMSDNLGSPQGYITQNGMPFSTYEKDSSAGSCSKNSGGSGGWWFNTMGCGASNLHGVWGKGGYGGVLWSSLNGNGVIQRAEMEVRLPWDS